MSRLLLPPRLPELDRRTDPVVDPDALIEEARRRARRRRGVYGGASLLAIGVALGTFFTFGGDGTTTPGRTGAGPPSRGLPPAGAIKGTLPLSVKDAVLLAARDRTLFVLVVSPGRPEAVTVLRVDRDGTVVRRPMPFDRSYYLADISTGPGGVYAGTAVIKRFVNVPDELVRIDPRTLTIRARAFFPSRVAAVEQGREMWASLGDGRVVRLDPRTLAIKTSQRLLAASAVATRGLSLSKPALGLGSLWVLAGDETDLELVRLDPMSLAVRSRTRVPTRGALAQALNRVVADPGHVYLVGSAIAAADAHGKLTGRPRLVPDLFTAVIHGAGLVGVGNAKPALLLVSAHGRLLAKTGLRDGGAELVVSGKDAWFLGDAGRGNGIVHVYLS